MVEFSINLSHTFAGSTIKIDSKTDRKKLINHLVDFSLPHCRLYNKRKNADTRAAKTKDAHAIYKVHPGNSDFSVSNMEA